MAKGEFTIIEAAGQEVRLSNPAKVYFPRPGWTKLDLAQFYLELADAVLVHVRERPTVMKRFVNGIQEEPIWQKRVPQKVPEWLQTATVAFPSGRTAEELVANDAAHLVWAVNLGVIDFNPWPARRADLDHPDELRVDLDPTPGVGWDDVRRTAMVVRDVLEAHGLRGYPKTSGSKGIHVNVRIEPRWESLEVRRAALALAREVERRAPGLATSKWWKEERHGVFVDYNQNARDRTVASCYSVRPTVDARVSCALRWDEVPDVEPGDLRLDTLPERIRTVGDPAADIDDRARRARRPARPRPPRRGGRARRRAVAAALPQAAGRAQARAAEPRPRPAGPAGPRRRPAARRAAARHLHGRAAARLRLQAPDGPGARARVRRLTGRPRRLSAFRPTIKGWTAVRRGTAPAGQQREDVHEGSCTRVDRGAGRRGGHDPARRRAGRPRARRARSRRASRQALQRADLLQDRRVPAHGVHPVRHGGDRPGPHARASPSTRPRTPRRSPPENLAKYDAVIFLCTTGDVLDADQQAAFEGYIQDGGGYAGIHSASDTEYDWAWYGGLVGAYFRDHPGVEGVNEQFQTATMNVEDRRSAATQGCRSAGRARRSGTTSAPTRGTPCTSCSRSTSRPTTRGATACRAARRRWATTRSRGATPYDGGRSFYTALGHRGEYWKEPLLLKHVLGGIRMAAGVAPFRCD